VEFGVLGPLRVVVNGQAVRLGGPRPRAVLGVLLVHAGESVSTSELIDQVWGEEPPATAVTALQVHVAALRKVVGGRIATTPSGYRLDVDGTEIDANRFERVATSVRREDVLRRPREVEARLAEALSWWRGEPYADVMTSTAVRSARLRLAELRMSTHEARLEAAVVSGRHAEAVSELAGMVSEHPTRERLAGLHMLALYRCGRIADARAAFARLRQRLRHELGVEPGEEVAALDRAIGRRDPTLAAPPEIAAPSSRFIGRRAELDRLAMRLGRTRLLTITGVGGVGKSRLAIELARELASDHPDGSHRIELASSHADGGVAERLATHLGRWANDERSWTTSLTKRFGAARALLILDNAEHVADGCAWLARELLAHCPGLRILVTSREPLGLAEEVVEPLGGLVITSTGRPDRNADAVRLLADRAQAARPGFTIAAGELAVATRLCGQLDGLPLAIEQAAAQLRTRSLTDIVRQLDRQSLAQQPESA